MNETHASKEQIFDQSETLLSITDLNSHIKYANTEFCKVAGYSNEELKGQPHNIVRHPDMPKQAFKDLWTFIRAGKSWMGPVKNRCKNGDYYWVNAYVTPIKDKSGQSIEYQSVRTKLDPEVQGRTIDVYAQLNAGKTPLQLKYQIDQTFWMQLALFVFTLASLALLVTSQLSLFITLPFLLIGVISSIMSISWRNKYQKLLTEAKSVFSNPLMNYLYSGHNDAIGSIQLALLMRKAETNAIIGRVTDVSLQVKNNAEIALEQSNKVSKSLSEQNNESEQVGVSINEMYSTVQDLSQSVTHTAESAEHSNELTTIGQETIMNSVSAINELSAQLTEVDGVIIKLSEGSNSIKSVLSEISSIADQTNLLALNAAIEAARAGEQGRGFAVVAEEVRALALRTQQATEEIQNLLQQLQTDSDNAVNAMAKGNILSDKCVTLSNEAGDALTNIHSEVSSISDATAQIATAIEQQSMVAGQVNQNIVRINEIALSCTENSQDASSLSSELLNKLSEQESLIEQFKC